MPRILAALLAAQLLFPATAAAQPRRDQTAGTKDEKPRGAGKGAGSASSPPPTTAAPVTTAPSLSPTAPSGSELSPAVRDIVRREVEKAKEEMRDEIRAEIQGAQSAQEFMGTTTAGAQPKLDFLQLHGYLRVRSDLFDNLDLRRTADRSGYYLFPRPLLNPSQHATITTANTRFRLEPTINVSEDVRVHAQLDCLDNLVLGSTPQGLFKSSTGNAFPFDSRGQVPSETGFNSERSSIVVKRAWGEVQTPVGLLSFGRMPSSWGLGILSHAGEGIDDDLGDSVDRLQFAVSPLKTALGSIVLVPMYEIVATGVTSQDSRVARGLGQPFDRDQFDDARSMGLKIVRADTPDEVKRKLERGESSLSYGLWYMYKSQSYEFPAWANGTSISNEGSTNQDTRNTSVGGAVKRDAYAHVLDFWGRLQTSGFRLEGEATGVLGQIGNASMTAGSTIGPVLLRQFGGVLQAEWTRSRLHFGGEAGIASGDRNPGFGNQPGRIDDTSGGKNTYARCDTDPQGGRRCDFDGEKFAPGDKVLDIRNFRFNPAYRVDQILWREIIGGVTGAFYLKPNIRWDVLEGLELHAAIVYSQSMYASSTPSTRYSPLGIEGDVGASYRSDDGFIAWLNYGFLQPLDGLAYSVYGGRSSLSRAHAIRAGVAIKF